MALYDLTHDVIAAALAGEIAPIAGQRSAVAPRGIIENNDSFTWFLIIIDVGPSARCCSRSSIDKNAPGDAYPLAWNLHNFAHRAALRRGVGQPSRINGTPLFRKNDLSCRAIVV